MRKRAGALLKDVSRARLAANWAAAMIAVGACSVFLGADLTAGNGELWLFACLAPPAVMLLARRGAAPASVVQPRP